MSWLHTGNQIGKDGCLALCRLLQDNQGITGFDLSGGLAFMKTSWHTQVIALCRNLHDWNTSLLRMLESRHVLPHWACGNDGSTQSNMVHALIYILPIQRSGDSWWYIAGNPCEEESPETMTQLDMYLERNRELLSCNGSVCPSPASNSPRMQRTKARIVDVSSCTQPLVTSPGRQIPSPKRRGNSYTSDYDGMSLKSEQMSTCSEDGDFQTR